MKRSRAVVVGLLALALCGTTTAASAGSLGSEPGPKDVTCVAARAGIAGKAPTGVLRPDEDVVVLATKDGKIKVAEAGSATTGVKTARTSASGEKEPGPVPASGKAVAGEVDLDGPVVVRKTKDGGIEIA